jgi:GT2 family glycosyltransferase
MSTVDVVVPCYNYGRYLRACVESILTQRDVDVRVLIIDDKSTDCSEEVGRALAQEDARVSYRRHAVNQGHIKTFNEGIIDWATADYTLLLSADDMLTPGALARAANALDRHPEAGLVCGMAVSQAGDVEPVAVPDASNPECRLIDGRAFIKRVCEFGNEFASPVVIVRTSVQHRLGGYNPKMHHTSDMEMWMRFACHGPVVILNAKQAYYRWHNQNMSSHYYSQAISDRREQMETCLLILSEQGHRVPELHGWVAEMKRRIGSELLVTASNSFTLHHDDTWKEILASAAEFDPYLIAQRDWWKLALKRMIGRPALRFVRKQLNKANGRSIRDTRLDWTNHGKITGWWPA